MDSRAHKAVAFLEDMLQEELPNNDLSEALQVNHSPLFTYNMLSFLAILTFSSRMELYYAS